MDHYKVLGLDKNANKAEIKEAFRKLALKFHPDKHSHSSKFIRDNAILKFKQASEAYEVLIDDRKRADYNQRFGGHRGGSGYGYNPNYYNRARNETPRYSPTSVSKRGGFDFDLTLRFLTSRGFLLNLSLAGVVLGAVAVINTSAETLWKMQNSGKSFEEAVESIEKKKRSEEKR